jgi:hypothetical protein
MSISDYILGHEDYEDVIRWKKAAGCFRRGDAVAISSLFMRTFCPDQEEGRDCGMCGLEARDVCDMMSRIQEAAEILEANETPRSWQITEERIGLLEYCLETLLDAPDIEEIPGPGHSIEVLRAMLTEAGQ